MLRKICSAALHQRAALLFHDPQAQISDARGRIYTSVHAWIQDTHPRLLSIFRDVDAESVAALALELGNVTLVLDEMDEAFRDKRYASPNSSVRRLIHYGRHHRVCLMGAFRRTPNVSEDLVSQCDRALLFRMSPSCPQDILTVRQRFGDPCADAVQTLDFGQFVCWQDSDNHASPASAAALVDQVVRELPKQRSGGQAAPPAPPSPFSPAPVRPSGGWLPQFWS